MHTSHSRTEHWKALVRLIGFKRVKGSTGIIVRKPKVIKAVMFFDSNYATNK